MLCRISYRLLGFMPHLHPAHAHERGAALESYYITQSCGGPSAAASSMLQSSACWLPLIAMLPSSQIQCIRVIHIGCAHIVCGRRSLTSLWSADVLPHLSATRIMRRRFLPSSFGLMDLAWGGKKIAQAAFTLRTKSETGPFVLDACADSPPPLTY